jgi:hypothetical protein
MQNLFCFRQGSLTISFYNLSKKGKGVDFHFPYLPAFIIFHYSSEPENLNNCQNYSSFQVHSDE